MAQVGAVLMDTFGYLYPKVSMNAFVCYDQPTTTLTITLFDVE